MPFLPTFTIDFYSSATRGRRSDQPDAFLVVYFGRNLPSSGYLDAPKEGNSILYNVSLYNGDLYTPSLEESAVLAKLVTRITFVAPQTIRGAMFQVHPGRWSLIYQM